MSEIQVELIMQASAELQKELDEEKDIDEPTPEELEAASSVSYYIAPRSLNQEKIEKDETAR